MQRNTAREAPTSVMLLLQNQQWPQAPSFILGIDVEYEVYANFELLKELMVKFLQKTLFSFCNALIMFSKFLEDVFSQHVADKALRGELRTNS